MVQSRKWLDFGLDRALFRRTHPLPFSVVMETIPDLRGKVKDLDISYAGRISNRKRIQAAGLLRANPDIRFEGYLYAEPMDRKSKLARGLLSVLLAKLQGDPYVSESERGTKLSPEQYYTLLGRSKIALSLRGGGFDTLRYWEIVASKTLLVSEWPDIAIPHNFEHGKHAVFCRPDLSDLMEVVRYYVQHDEEREAITANGYAHLLKYQTCEQRAEYFLDICRRSLGNQR